MMIVTRTFLLSFTVLFSLACIGAKTEKRGYLYLIGATVMGALLLVSFSVV